MCVYSMVMDHKWHEWQDRRPQPIVPFIPAPPVVVQVPLITQAEVDEFHRLLERAREYDRKHGEPDCELEEKKEKLRTLARELGVEISFGDGV